MRIIITEEQSKKIFVPRKIDDRMVEYEGIIKKYLVSIKDHIIWGLISKIIVTYDSVFDEIDVLLYDKKDQQIGDWDRRRILIDYLKSKYGEKYDSSILDNTYNFIDGIVQYIDSLLPKDEVIFNSMIEIINHGNGKLEYKQSRKIIMSDENYIVIST